MGNPASEANYATDFWVPIGIFLPLAILVSAARLYRRARPVWQLTSDDYTLAFAFVSGFLWLGCLPPLDWRC
jgi:hypothetical protein